MQQKEPAAHAPAVALPNKGSLAGARYLLANKDPKDLGLTLGDFPKDFYLQQLVDEESWQNYKRFVADRIAELSRAGDPKNELEYLQQQQKTQEEIDALIANGTLQKSLISLDVLKNKHPKFMEALKEREHNLAQWRADGRQTQFWNRAGEIEENMRKMCEENHSLAALVGSISSEDPHFVVYDNRVKAINQITHFTHFAEPSAEKTASTAEIIHQAKVYVASLEAMEKTSAASGAAEVAHAVSVLEVLPVINNFIRGIHYTAEAIQAMRDPNTPQRTAKIAAGLIGGAASISVGIVGSLLLAGVGGLVAGTPIILAAVTVGVYTVALSRDSYSLLIAHKHLKQAQGRLAEIEQHIETKQSEQNPENNPELALLSIEKANLSEAITHLEKARNQSFKKVLISAVSLLGVGLILGAVCSTGVGALVLGAVAGTALVGASVARLWMVYKERKSHKEALPHAAETSEAHEATQTHTEHPVDLTQGKQHLPTVSKEREKALAVHPETPEGEEGDEDDDRRRDDQSLH